MAEENIFKTVPLGFNKSDVIKYIGELKIKESRLAVRVDDLQKQLSEQSEADTSDYEMKIDELAKQVNECCACLVEREKEVAEKDAELIKKERENDELRRAFDEYRQKYESSGRSVEAIQNKIASLEKVLGEKEQTIEYYKEQLAVYEHEAAEFKKRSENYENEMQALHSASEKLRVLETQLGSSIIDARRYADRIIRDAKSKATAISSEVYIAVNQTTAKVNSLADDMQAFNSNFYDSMKSLKSRLVNLSGSLDDVALELIGKTENTAAADSDESDEA